ncbi:juvenile hormone esterase-like [Colias croceus]|uniref:juvenile hormone esterase-like n=1 Tax=Colias crocea TaxID=72248 RepID=UPI001E27DA33|nr:juvenile hormone esterase-like [Colias croceus]
MVRIKVNEGVLEGCKVNNVYGKPYFSFKGIPYAEPPLGDLRFKAPKPKTPWTGVREAKKHGPVSCQMDVIFAQSTEFKGEEDCLYLNVYTPNIEPENPLPVMVYIHGGGFLCGSGNDDQYEPEFLIKNDVILVTINYRLDVLGFLSLDTEDIPGNAGMKDQVAALRWVQNNIRNFGGNPVNVTIFGESAGAASVSAHLISPMSKGLFKRAITQSGTTLCPWAQTYGARDRAILLARELGCECNNDKEIFEFFKNQPAENLVNRKVPIFFTESAKLFPHVCYAIVSEKKFKGQECFIEGDFFELMRNGNCIHEGVEVMNGYTEDEGILYFAMGSPPEKVIEQASHYAQFFVPHDIMNHVPPIQQMALGKKIKKYYLKDQLVNKERNFDELLKFLSMDYFIHGALTWQKLCAKKSKNKIFLYKFSCKSERNLFAHMIGCSFVYEKRIPVSHVDDLLYLFPFSIGLPAVDVNSKTFKMIDQFTKLWTNFAKYGNPTPDDSLGAQWLPYTSEQNHYLDIGEKLTPGTSPDIEQMQFWEDFYREYCPQRLC